MNLVFPSRSWRGVASVMCMGLVILVGCGKDQWVPKAWDTEAGPLEMWETPHRVALLEDGKTALEYRLFLLRSARHSIRIQTFILSDDPIGWLIMQELVRAARRGVKVQLVSDAMFTDVRLDRLADLGNQGHNLEVRIYNPPTDKIDPGFLRLGGAMAKWRRFQQRMHNKLWVVDDRIAICGGRNIADEYYDEDPALNFLDLDIVVQGPILQDISASFTEYWNSPLVVPIEWMADVRAAISGHSGSTGTPQIFDEKSAVLDAHLSDDELPLTWHQVQRIAFWADPPHKPDSSEDPTAIARRLAELLARTQHDLLLQSPYLVLSDRAIEIFKKLREKQVLVRVSTNSLAATDNWLSYAHSLRQRRMMLLDLKLEMYEMKAFPGDLTRYMPEYEHLRARVGKTPINQPPGPPDPKLCLHSKALIIDNWISLVGTYNLDPRSGNLNTENGVALWDASFSRYLRSKIERDMSPANSWVVAKQSVPPPLEPLRELIEEVNELAMTITSFDVWPLRYSALFELKEGMEPIPPDHPDFYDHYRSVGLFPGIKFLDFKLILVELARMFTGVFRPLI